MVEESLTEMEYWDSIYKSGESIKGRRKSRKNSCIEKLYNSKWYRYIIRYAEYIRWEILYKKYLPQVKGLKVLEVGSAPGYNLIRLYETFGYIPYGIEYTDSGAKLNKYIFKCHNIDSSNVIHEDFFSKDFHQQYKGYFDVVLSSGFIEHFKNTEDVIKKHIDLLKENGYLVVSVPNFTGINYIFAEFFDKEILSSHLLDIMDKEYFLKFFENENIYTLFCDYIGVVINFAMFRKKSKWPLRIAVYFCIILQIFMNSIFLIFLRNNFLRSKLISTDLIYIGQKRIDNSLE